MPVNVTQQTIVFFACILTGIVSGIIFDMLSITAKKLRFGKSAFFIQDIIIWFVILAFFFTVIYKINGAVLRWYIFLGALFGTLFYLLLLRVFVVKIISWILQILESVFIRILKIFALPLKKMLMLFKSIGVYVQNVRKNINNFVQKNIEKLRRINILLKKI